MQDKEILAEISLVASLATEPGFLQDALASISPDQMRSDRAREVYQTLVLLDQDGVMPDVLQINDRAKNPELFGELSGLAEMMRDHSHTPASIPGLIKLVAENHSLRRVEQAAKEALNIIKEREDGGVETLAKAEGVLFKAFEIEGRSSTSLVHVSQDVPKVLQSLEERSKRDDPVTGVRSGIVDLDDMTTGFQPGELTVLAGRPSMGKSAAAGKIAESCCRRGGSAVIFSMEMTRENWVQREICSIGSVNFQNMRTGQLSDEEWERCRDAADEISRWDLYIDETGAASLDYIRAVCRRHAVRKQGLDLIIIDYLQLMTIDAKSRNSNRAEDIGAVTGGLKALAKQLNVPIVLLSQLNRSLEGRLDKRPLQSDLRESGAIEQDADLIIFLYRDEVYDPDTPERGICEWIIRKQRNGPIGTVRTVFEGHFSRFKNLGY